MNQTNIDEKVSMLEKPKTAVKKPKKKTQNYDAASIKRLEGLEAVRVRPGMYIGSTGSGGLMHLLKELVDNAVDEAAEGHGGEITVIFHKDNSYEVCDLGRGIPTGKHNGGPQTALEIVFSDLHAGGKFNTDSYAASGGLHGVGASVVNAMSNKVRVEVDSKKQTLRLDFVECKAGHYNDDKESFRTSSTLKKVAIIPANQTGTRVRFWPDRDLFDNDATIEIQTVEEWLHRTTWLLPGIVFTLIDERGSEPSKKQLVAPNGLLDAIASLSQAPEIAPAIQVSGKGIFSERIVSSEGGDKKTVERPCEVHVALCWTTANTPIIETFVNTVSTPDGGTHLLGFERGLTSEIGRALKTADLQKLRKVKELGLRRDDVMSGLVAAIRVIVPEPHFSGQTKRELSGGAITDIVRDVVREGVGGWLDGKGSRKSHVRAVIDHIAEAILDRAAAAAAASERKKIRDITSGAMPAKLADCRSHPGGELLLVEGDSAAGPAKRARDAQWQAVLPLRGKIVNAAKSTVAATTANAESAALIAALGGGGIGVGFNIDTARYSRIILLADADVDGAHIRCLLLTLMWSRMRDFLKAGRVYVAQPPTHALLVRGKKEFIYGNEALEKRLSELAKKNIEPRLTRFKGLGEMDDDELYYTTLNPETRTLRQVIVEDKGAAKEAVNTMMGPDVVKRKEFIEKYASDYDSEIDN